MSSYNWRQYVRKRSLYERESKSNTQAYEKVPSAAAAPLVGQGSQPALSSFLSQQHLAATLARIDGKGYKAYCDLRGAYMLECGVILLIDYVQSDPFAPPSRVRARVPMSLANFPPSAFCGSASALQDQQRDLLDVAHVKSQALSVSSNRIFQASLPQPCDVRRIALCDYLARRFVAIAQQVVGQEHEADVFMERPSQHVLQRSSVCINSSFVEARFTVRLPAQGRSIVAHVARKILLEHVPHIARNSLCFDCMPQTGKEMWQHILCVEDQEALRSSLGAAGLAAFVLDGACLPRRSGASDEPMAQEDLPVLFESPPSLRVGFRLPHTGVVSGMGLPLGVSLIVGGGFHGKSTLLKALQWGVYNHVPGDGREFVVVDASAVTIRAEDGRSCTHVDISPFINNLPFGKSTAPFSCDNCSGSTSQVANIMESLELGATTLLIDEDVSATNFLIRDSGMQQLVAEEKEPIRPLVSRVRDLYYHLGVSTVFVFGGSSDYFSVADTVVMMDCYRPEDVTQRAKQIAAARGLPLLPPSASNPFSSLANRALRHVMLLPHGNDVTHEKVKAHGIHTIVFGQHHIDLSAVEQIAEQSQTVAIADALLYLGKRLPQLPLRDALIRLAQEWSLADATNASSSSSSSSSSSTRVSFSSRSHGSHAAGPAPPRCGLDGLARFEPHGGYSQPRIFEVAAAVNRSRLCAVSPKS